MSIDLTDYTEALSKAVVEGSFCVLATQGAAGTPDIGFKGSMHVFDRDHLAYWERTRGEHLSNLRVNPGVAVLYFSRERGKYLRLYGQAELHEAGPVREQIMGGTPGPELEKDSERKGIGVRIRVDRLEEAFAGISQRREATDVA